MNLASTSLGFILWAGAQQPLYLKFVSFAFKQNPCSVISRFIFSFLTPGSSIMGYISCWDMSKFHLLLHYSWGSSLPPFFEFFFDFRPYTMFFVEFAKFLFIWEAYCFSLTKCFTGCATHNTLVGLCNYRTVFGPFINILSAVHAHSKHFSRSMEGTILFLFVEHLQTMAYYHLFPSDLRALFVLARGMAFFK